MLSMDYSVPKGVGNVRVVPELRGVDISCNKTYTCNGNISS